jgi:uncharacterized membrane protein
MVPRGHARVQHAEHRSLATFTFAQECARYPLEMPRSSPLDAARLRRDLGLARARRFTVYAAMGATGLTAVIAFGAALSIPGRSAAAASPATQANPGAIGVPGGTQPGLTGPISAPQNGNPGAPIVVSGGS